MKNIYSFTSIFLFVLSACIIFFLGGTALHAQGTRIWATYYGGAGDENPNCVAVDASGNVLLAGQTNSTSNISAGGFQNAYGGNIDAFLVKFDAAGNRLWGTYYGAIMGDVGNSVATDTAGNVYLAGYTSSNTAIATAGAFQTTNNGNGDAFLVKFDPNGNRLWGTYYGGTGSEYGWIVTTDISGNVFLAGYTTSMSGIASASAFQAAFSGGYDDGFLVKFDSNGNRLWATYYGGTNDDAAKGLATDPSGNVYIAGNTASPAGIASGGFQNTIGSSQDGFLVKFDPNGNRLWGTYYGGTAADVAQSVGTDPAGNVFLSGWTDSPTGIASVGGFQTVYGGGPGPGDAYLVKFDASGNRLWATYYGGSNAEETANLAIDSSGNSYLCGETYSDNIGNCIAINGYQNALIGTGNHENTYLVKFDSNGNRLCATYYGQQHEEYGYAAVDGNTGNVYLTAYTTSPTGISSGGFQNTYGGGDDAYLVKFGPCCTIPLAAISGASTICSGQNLTLTASGGNNYSWSTGSTSTTIIVSPTSTTSYSVIVTNSCGSDSTVATVTVGALTVTTSVTPSTCLASNGTATITPTGGNSPYTYNWSPSGGTTSTATGLSAGNYSVTVTDATGCSGTTTLTITSSNGPNVSLSSQTNILCNGGNNGSAIITVTGGASPYTYNWSPSGGTSSAASGLSSGNYSVTVTDANGCTSAQTVSITQPAAITATTTTSATACNNNNGTASAAIAGGTSPYSYSWSSGQTTSAISNLAAGNYSLTITDANGCTQTATATVTSIGGPTANAGADVSIANGSTTILSATGGGTYSWNTGETTAAINVGPSATSTYTVIVTDANGCTAMDSVTVFIVTDNCGGTNSSAGFFLPNAFSPNNDGVNDNICLQGMTDCIKEFSITIYNRWGEKIYESTNKLFCWDGTYNAKPEGTAVFAYYLKAVLQNGDEVKRKGNISLLR